MNRGRACEQKAHSRFQNIITTDTYPIRSKKTTYKLEYTTIFPPHKKEAAQKSRGRHISEALRHFPVTRHRHVTSY